MAYQSTPQDKKWALGLGLFYVLLAIALGYMLFKVWPPVPWPDADKHPQAIAKALKECPTPIPTPTPVVPVGATSTPAPAATITNASPTPVPSATAAPTQAAAGTAAAPGTTPSPTPSPTPLEAVAMPINFPFMSRCVMTTFDERLLLLVIVAGMLGSFVHGATSLADYIGNNRFSRRWTWFYLLRPVIGMALALVFYFVIRGGFLTTNVGATDINPYGIAALAGLVGMFSKQATDKLSEVFSTLFRSGEGDQKRADPLTPGAKSVPAKVEPAEVPAGSDGQILTVTGTDFVADCVVYLDELPQTTTFDSATQLTVEVAREVLATPAVLKLTVVNPDATRSTAIEFKVVGATSVPTVASIDPIQAAAGEEGLALTINGAGFVDGSLVKLNAEPLETTFDSPTKLTASVAPNLIATAGVLKLKVVNPDNTESSEVDFTVA